MTRVGESLDTGYSWNDNDDNKCYQISDSTNYEICNKITTCSKCLRSGSCNYSDHKCSVGSTTFGDAEPDTIYEECKSRGVTDHDFTICGYSEVSLAKYSKQYDFKPETSTPKDTL